MNWRKVNRFLRDGNFLKRRLGGKYEKHRRGNESLQVPRGNFFKKQFKNSIFQFR